MKMNLPTDIIILIFNHLNIIDQRSWVKCNKQLNQLYFLIEKSEKEFLKLIHNSELIDKKIINKCNIYALEAIYYCREDILKKYFNEETRYLLHHYPLLFHHIAKYNPNICKKIYTRYGKYGNSIINGAAAAGNLKLIKWIHGKGVPLRSEVRNWASLSGNLEVLKWTCEPHPGEYSWACKITANAASQGHLEILKWARKNGCYWDELTCENAANHGYLEVLKWVRANNCPWNSSTCDAAAIGGHLEVLKWARENGCPWDFHTCDNAASGGHLEVLQWARANGCQWSTETCTNAAQHGHLEVLQWAHVNGCPWDENTCIYAAKNNHFELCKWAIENGCGWNAHKELRELTTNKKQLQQEIDELNIKMAELNEREKGIIECISVNRDTKMAEK